MPNRDPLLSFEEFAAPIPGLPIKRYRRNNFHLHFVDGPGIPNPYKKNLPYIRCLEAHPDVFGGLIAELEARGDYYSPDYVQKLYEAYKLMHPYAESNYQLFG